MKAENAQCRQRSGNIPDFASRDIRRILAQRKFHTGISASPDGDDRIRAAEKSALHHRLRKIDHSRIVKMNLRRNHLPHIGTQEIRVGNSRHMRIKRPAAGSDHHFAELRHVNAAVPDYAALGKRNGNPPQHALMRKIGGSVHGIDDPAGIRQAQIFRALFSEESGLGR